MKSPMTTLCLMAKGPMKTLSPLALASIVAWPRQAKRQPLSVSTILAIGAHRAVVGGPPPRQGVWEAA